jgi:hypothetical protein
VRLGSPSQTPEGREYARKWRNTDAYLDFASLD